MTKAALTAVVSCFALSCKATVIDLDAGGTVSNFLGVPFHFTVSGVAGPIADLDLRFSLQITDVSGVSFDLAGPDGMPHSFGDRMGLGSNFQDTYLDDEAGGSRVGEAASDIAPFASGEWGGRSYRPNADLSVFDGMNPNGVWTIVVYNFSPNGGDGQFFRAGDDAPWGTAIGTQLVVTAVPEPSGILILGLLATRLARRRN